MPPKKRRAAFAISHRDPWQPTGPCRFLQLTRALAMNILSRLSPNTLINCRCVCKAWLFIISDPHFNSLLRSRNPTGILIQKYYQAQNWKSRTLDFTQVVESAAPELQLERMIFRPKVSMPLIGNRNDSVMKYGLINSCNGLLCLSGPKNSRVLYVCNPILGEMITLPLDNNGIFLSSFVALGFSASSNVYKVMRKGHSHNAQIYTIGTGTWRSIGEAPRGIVQTPFNAVLHGAIHWATSIDWEADAYLYSFNFETEQFQTVPPPSHFAPKTEETESITLGVLDGCLLLCAFAVGFYYNNDFSKFDMWVMKDYGVQESWTKFLVVENLYCGRCHYHPSMFLNNGEILMAHGCEAVVRYNPETKTFRETSIAPSGSEFFATSYSPSFVSLYDIAKGEEVERMRNNENFHKLFSERISGSGDFEMPSECINLAESEPADEVDLLGPSPITSSVTNHEQLSFTLRAGTECAICSGHLGYVFRGKGFAVCQKCFDAGS